MKFAGDRHFSHVGMGPDPDTRDGPMGHFASLGKQRGTHLSKYGVELVVPHGDSALQHIADALQCEHPYATNYKLALDVLFALDALTDKLETMDAWRNRQLCGLRNLCTDALPLDKSIKSRSHPSTLKVTERVNVVAHSYPRIWVYCIFLFFQYTRVGDSDCDLALGSASQLCPSQWVH